MPFVADRDGEVVTPDEVRDDASLSCLDCGEELRVRKHHERDGEFVARHFWHVGGGADCPRGGGGSGGESEVHRRLKSIVLSKLKDLFPVAEAGVETRVGANVADVFARFEERDETYGRGVVCEVQYRNEGKDVASATKNYLEEGYSVCWIEGAAVDGLDVEFSEPAWYYPGNLQKYLQEDFMELRDVEPEPPDRPADWPIHVGYVDRIPEQCPHYNGPEHEWEDYGWADQGKMQCIHCGATVDKDQFERSQSPFDTGNFYR